LLVSLLNVAVFFSRGPTADDIHDDAVVPANAVISNFNSIPALAVVTFNPAVACVPADACIAVASAMK
jgi:hypothetical protein